MHKTTIVGGMVAITLATSLLAPAAASAAPSHLTGVVLSPGGAPAPGVFVTDGNDLGFTGNTDANGRFDFPNPNGITKRVYLCAKLAQNSALGGAAGWSNACGYVTPGVDGKLRFKTGSAFGGLVTDVKSGKPLAGATVSVFDDNDGSTAEVVTDATGHWIYRNLVPGTLNLVPSSAQKVWSAAPHGYDGAGPARTGVVLRAGQVRNDIGIQVAPLVLYSGTFTYPAGTIQGPAVAAVRTYDTFVQSPPTSGAGNWSVLAPWSGVADLCVWGTTYEDNPNGYAVSCSVVRSKALSVSATSTLSSTLGGIAHGAVVGTDGRAIGIADVTAEVPVPTGGTLTLHGRRDATGYEIASLPAGTYVVRATETTGLDGDVSGLAGPVAVNAGHTSTFSTITLDTGGN